MQGRALTVLTLATGLATIPTHAATTQIDGGRTSVALDFETLESVGLAVSGVSADVLVPGTLEGSVAFTVNTRTDDLPSTFAYDAGDFLGTFSGTIEHAGSVFFNDGTLEVGDFTIGFDAARVSGTTSGFFVESTSGLVAILFDVATPQSLVVTANGIEVGADLLVSPELDGALGGMGALTGADVGDALVEALAITSPQLDATITQAITDLMPFSADRDVNKAIERLEDALATFDGDEPTDRVFKELAKAVKELDDGEGFGGVIESLRLASRAVAIGAFREGFIGGGDSRDLLKALKELQKGDRDSWNGKPDKAIQAYGKSWERSRDSLS